METKENYKKCPSYYGGDSVDNGEKLDLFTFAKMHRLSPMQVDVMKRVMRLGKKGGRKEAADDVQKINYVVERIFKEIDFMSEIESIHSTHNIETRYLGDIEEFISITIIPDH